MTRPSWPLPLPGRRKMYSLTAVGRRHAEIPRDHVLGRFRLVITHCSSCPAKGTSLTRLKVSTVGLTPLIFKKAKQAPTPTEPVASTSQATPLEPVITPRDARVFSSVIRKAVASAAPGTLVSVVQASKRRLAGASQLHGRSDRVNRLPVTVLIHALIKHTSNRRQRKDFPHRLEALFLLFEGQADQEAAFVDWSKLSKRTRKAVMHALTAINWRSVPAAGLDSWPKELRPDATIESLILAAEPKITPQDSRQFAALIKANIRFAYGISVPALVRDCVQRFKAAWALRSRGDRTNLLPVVSLIHALLRHHKPSVALPAIYQLLENQNHQTRRAKEVVFTNWAKLPRRTVAAIAHALVQAEQLDVISPQPWPTALQPRQLIVAASATGLHSDAVALYPMCARTANDFRSIGSPVQAAISKSAQHVLAHQKKADAVDGNLQRLLDFLRHNPGFISVDLIHGLGGLPRNPSYAFIPDGHLLSFADRLEPTTDQQMLRDNSQLLYLLIRYTYRFVTFQLRDQRTQELLDAFQAKGVPIKKSVHRHLLDNAADKKLLSLALRAYGLERSDGRPGRGQRMTDAGIAAYLHYLVQNKQWRKAMVLTYKLVPRRLPTRYLARQKNRHQHILRDQALFDSMLSVASSQLSIGLAQHIWRAALITQTRTVFIARNWGPAAKADLIPTESYVKMLSMCLKVATDLNRTKGPNATVLGWDPRFAALRPPTLKRPEVNMTLREGARSFAMRVFKQLERYAGPRFDGLSGQPVINDHIRHLMWQIFHPTLKPTPRNMDWSTAIPANEAQATLLRKFQRLDQSWAMVVHEAMTASTIAEIGMSSRRAPRDYRDLDRDARPPRQGRDGRDGWDGRDGRWKDPRESRDNRRRTPSPSRRRERSRERGVPLRDQRDRTDRDYGRRDGPPPPRRRSRSPVRSQRIPAPRPHRDKSPTPPPPAAAASHTASADAATEVPEDDDAAMKAMLGFSGFDTTSGKHVAGNSEKGAVAVSRTRQYRQYMNRQGGFNRALDKMD